MNQFCPNLNVSSDLCELLGEKCFRTQQKEKCQFFGHLERVRNINQDGPLSVDVKKTMELGLIEEWKSFAKNFPTGKKTMTGSPLEEAVRKILARELTPIGVTVYDQCKKFVICRARGEDVSILADCLSEKEGREAVVSVKTWLGPEQIRETYAYAALAKAWLGQRDLRVYQVGLREFEERSKPLADACKPYLDGVYSLSSEPYFDKLMEEMKRYFAS